MSTLTDRDKSTAYAMGRQARRYSISTTTANPFPGGTQAHADWNLAWQESSVECPFCHWGLAPGVIKQHIREKHNAAA